MCHTVSFQTGCIKLPSVAAMLKDIQCKQKAMAKRYCNGFSYLYNNLHIMDLLRAKSCFPQHVQYESFVQVRHQSETHHPGGLYQLHGWDSRTGGSSSQNPKVAADWSQAGPEGDIRSLHPIPVSSQRARKVGRGPSGHPHSVGEGGSTHADQAHWWPQTQEILQVASGSVGCLCGIGCIHLQEQPSSLPTRSHCTVRQDKSVPVCTVMCNWDW